MTTVLDVVIPVHNEQAVLAAAVHRLDAHLRDTFPYPYRITVADNASTDATWQVAGELVATVASADAATTVAAAVAAFRGGAQAVAKGPRAGGRGTATDTFNLSGFSAAYDAISQECPPSGRR